MLYNYNYIRDNVLVGLCKNKARVAHYTRILRDGDNFVMDWGSGKRYSCPIMTFFPNGDKSIDYRYSPGWGTMERFRMGGVRMIAERTYVAIVHGGQTIMYQQGMVLHADGTVSGANDTRNFHDVVAEHKKDIARRARWHVGGESQWCKVGDVVTREANNQYYLSQQTDDSWLVRRVLFNGNGRTKVDLVSVKTGETHEMARWGFTYKPDKFLTLAYHSRKPLTSTVESGTSEV